VPCCRVPSTLDLIDGADICLLVSYADALEGPACQVREVIPAKRGNFTGNLCPSLSCSSALADSDSLLIRALQVSLGKIYSPQVDISLSPCPTTLLCSTSVMHNLRLHGDLYGINLDIYTMYLCRLLRKQGVFGIRQQHLPR
jgi:hypothetical protein